MLIISFYFLVIYDKNKCMTIIKIKFQKYCYKEKVKKKKVNFCVQKGNSSKKKVLQISQNFLSLSNIFACIYLLVLMLNQIFLNDDHFSKLILTLTHLSLSLFCSLLDFISFILWLHFYY